MTFVDEEKQETDTEENDMDEGELENQNLEEEKDSESENLQDTEKFQEENANDEESFKDETINSQDANDDIEEDFGEEIGTEHDKIEDNDDDEDEFDEEGIPEDDFDEEELKNSAETDEHTHKKNIVEGALFVAGRPVSIEEIHAKSDLGKKEIQDLLDEIAMDYLMRPTALEIVQIQEKYSLQIKPEYTPKLKNFASGGLIPDRILKTLTIIALKQPLLKSKLVKIRGSTAYEHVKYLVENGYIEAYKKGRSSELITTDLFADTFGLSRDINELKKQMIIQLGVKEQE